jgi:nucleoside-diphosphate-sugar epimerase
MADHKRAVVVGALGVIGRYIVERLLAQGDWSVVGLSRRAAASTGAYQHIAVDLLDAREAIQKLSGLHDVTHIFYAAFQASPGAAFNYAATIGPNRDMLVNAVSAIEQASRWLRRVVLVTGTKYYGVHLGPIKSPAREADPRHMPPNFYFDQIDWLTGFQRGKGWDWVELRPHTLCGFAPDAPMSLLPAIAVYAAMSKELGLPLRFPGKLGAYSKIYQVTESEHFAKAALWAAVELSCGFQAFNITNGDYFRWQNLWPKIAEVFDMPAGEPQQINLSVQMADKEPLWRAMNHKYALRCFAYTELVSWPFADYVFNSDWDVMSDVTKSRLFGFHEVVDSERMFTRLLQQFRKERIVP